MKTIKALKNFGFGEKHIEPGTVLTVDPEEFGGTYNDFLAAGLFEEVSEPAASPTPEPAAPAARSPKPAKVETVTVKEADGSVETVHPGSEVKAPTD